MQQQCLIIQTLTPAKSLTNSDFMTKSCKSTSGTDCGFVEVFAGSCRLSKACRDVGFRVTAVDKDKSRSEGFSIYNWDLGDEEQYQMLEKYLEPCHSTLLHVHFAHASNTTSRALEKPIRGVPEHQQPRPLRSNDYPDGLEHLTEAERRRVELANISYNPTAMLCIFLIRLNVSASIENPESSFFFGKPLALANSSMRCKVTPQCLTAACAVGRGQKALRSGALAQGSQSQIILSLYLWVVMAPIHANRANHSR